METWSFKKLFDWVYLLCVNGTDVVIRDTDDTPNALRLAHEDYVEYGYLNGDVIVPVIKIILCSNDYIMISRVEPGRRDLNYLSFTLDDVFCSDDPLAVSWVRKVQLTETDYEWIKKIIQCYQEKMAIIREKITVRKCHRCGNYFIPRDKRSVYCDSVDEASGLTCGELGRKESWQKKLANDSILKAYNRAYKTHFARKKSGTMTEEELKAWRREAKEKLQEARDGKLDVESFRAWLRI